VWVKRAADLSVGDLRREVIGWKTQMSSNTGLSTKLPVPEKKTLRIISPDSLSLKMVIAVLFETLENFRSSSWPASKADSTYSIKFPFVTANLHVLVD
jgi:hypothetical protein